MISRPCRLCGSPAEDVDLRIIAIDGHLDWCCAPCYESNPTINKYRTPLQIRYDNLESASRKAIIFFDSARVNGTIDDLFKEKMEELRRAVKP